VTGAAYALLAAILAIFAALCAALRTGGRTERAQIEAIAARTAAEAERNRTELDDEISQDVDLAARARRIGLVRPGSE
jgi:hypothetical protein